MITVFFVLMFICPSFHDIGETYIVDALDEIQRIVVSENSYYRTTRRNLAVLNVIEKVCIVLLSHHYVITRYFCITNLPQNLKYLS